MLTGDDERMFNDDLNVYTYCRLGDLAGAGEEDRGRRKSQRTLFPLLARLFAAIGQTVQTGLTSAKGFLGRYIYRFLAHGFHLTDLFHLIAGGLLARGAVLGELLPFGGAYLAATLVFRPGLAGLMVFSVVLGLWSTSIPAVFWNQVAVILLLTSVITSARKKPEQWWILLPLLVMAVYLLVQNCFLIWHGWNLYQEISIIFEAIIAGVLSFIFMIAVQWIENREKPNQLRAEEMIAAIVLGVCLILGICDLHIGQWELGPLTASLGVLIAAYLGGAGAGSAAGALIGLLPSVTHLIMPYAVGVYAVAGLLAGLFRAWGRLGMAVGFLLGNLLLTLYLAEGGASPESLIQLGSGVVIFLLLPTRFFSRLGTQIQSAPNNPKSGFLSGMFSFSPSRSNENETINDNLDDNEMSVNSCSPASRLKEAADDKESCGSETGQADVIWWKMTGQKLKNLGGMLNEISATLEKEKGSALENNSDRLVEFMDSVRQGPCLNCSAQRVCWEEDFYATYRILLDLLSLGESREKLGVTLDEAAPFIKNRCLYPRDLVNQVNRVSEKFKLESYWLDRMEEGRDLVACQVKGLADVVNKVISEFEKRAERIKPMEKRLSREFKRLGVNAERIQAYRLPSGELELYFYRKACPGDNDCRNRLLPALTSILGQQLELRPDRCPWPAEQGCEVCLVGGGRLTVEVGVACRAEDGYNCSGDNYLTINLPGARYLLALSDGMGVGPVANETSRSTLSLLETVLGAGLPTDQAVCAVNSLLLLRSKEESFATLDLAIINLQSGDGEFFKLGATPTFLVRQGKVTVISANSPPIGILDTLEVNSLKHRLEPGDLVVMVTDGLLDSRFHVAERDSWLGEVLEKINSLNPREIANTLLEQALANCSRVRDDMAVLVARIDER
ncbi:MAG: SpoIIE family protein phosphatase [Bacillota bacterium]